MIRHVVMWAVKDEYEGMTKPQIIEKMCAEISAMEGNVPEIINLAVAPSLTSGGYDVCLTVDFADLAALKAYDTHPAHEKVKQFIGKMRLSRAAADIEM